MNTENISKALSVFIDAMRQFVVKVLTTNSHDEPWEGLFFSSLPPDKQTTWNKAVQNGAEPANCIDYSNLSLFVSSFRNELQTELQIEKSTTYNMQTWLNELQNVRNKVNHYQPISEDEYDRAFSNMNMVATTIKRNDLRLEIKRLKDKTTHTPATVAPTAVATVTNTAINTNIHDDGSPLKAWFENCLPHYDIKNGVLDESLFAANLNEVVMGTAPEVYINPITFFDKTYITAGLRDISNRVVRALNGEATENRIISLQTGFGGGKTHTLISLYHIIRGGRHLLSSPSCANIMQNGVMPEFDDAKVAVFTNNTTDVSQGRTTADGLTIHTLWGELAYQLCGRDGYERVRKNDEDLIAPTSSIFKPVLEAASTSLILIDELADYCVKAAAKMVGGGNLYNQTNSFVQTLTETVASVPRCVLIATLPASQTEVADSQIGQDVLESLQVRLVRIGTNVKPVDDNEVFEVVRRRLFEQINDENVVDAVAKRYKTMYHNRSKDLPEGCDGIKYAQSIKQSYPFHPELIDMFRLRWGSDSRFQRTRGVLRLLASIVQDLWKRRDQLSGQALIHTSDVCLENLPSLTGTITNLMGSTWETVMLADVYGKGSNSRKIDELNPQSNLYKYSLTQGIATTLLLASVGVRQRGMNIKGIKLCLLRPNAFNHNDVNTALGKLEQVAHYLHTAKVEDRTYWFESKANINILLSQAKNDIKQEEMDEEIVCRLKSSCNYVNEPNVIVAPKNDVPEQKSLTLAILHPIYAKPVGGSNNMLDEEIRSIATKRGNGDRFYRNTIFFLVCSQVGRTALYGKLQDFLACDRITDEYGSQLEDDQKKEIASRRHEYNRQVDEALLRAYNVAAKHSAKGGTEWYELKNYASDFSTQIKRNLMDELTEEEWIISAIGRNLLLRINMWPIEGHAVSVRNLYETFLRFDDKPMIRTAQAVVATVDRYCANGLWNVAFGTEGNYSNVYHDTTVQLLDVTSDEYWLVDTSVCMEADTSKSDDAGGNGDAHTDGNDNNHSPSQPSDPKTFRSITISGDVEAGNFQQLYASFVNTLKENRLHIEVRFTARSTDGHPLTENSATIKSVKESASQLKLDFEAEE